MHMKSTVDQYNISQIENTRNIIIAQTAQLPENFSKKLSEDKIENEQIKKETDKWNKLILYQKPEESN